jgi:peptidyl-prolyl cis-trans isomerase D
MLEVIRNHKRWLMFFILVLIMPSFVFFGIQGYNQLVEGDRAIARVAGQAITQPEVDEAARRFLEQLRRQYGQNLDPKLLDTPAMRAGVVERLMSEKVLLAEVARSNVHFGDEQLMKFYSSTPEFLADGQFSIDKKQEVARALGLSVTALDQLIRREQSALVLRGAVNATGFVPASVRDRLVALSEEQREVRELRVKPDEFVPQVKITDDAIKTHYEANRKQFEIPESINVEYVVLTLDAFAGQIKVEESELRKQYDAAFGTNLKRRDEVRAKAEALLAEVRKAPASFAELAQKNSEDPGSAANGGALPPFGRGEMVKPFEDAAYKLRKGELAPNLIETEFGFHILRLDDIQGDRRVARHILLNAPEARRFEDVRAELERSARQQEAQRKFVEATDSFSNTVYEQPDSLQPVAEKLKLPIQRVEGLTRAGPPPRTTNAQAFSPKFIEALFADEAVKSKRNTQAIEGGPGTLIAGRVVEHKPATLRPLESVQAEIKASLEQIEASKLAREAAEKKAAALRAAPSDVGFSPARKVSRAKPEGLPIAALRTVMAVDGASLPAYVVAELDGGAFGVFRVLGREAAPAPDAAKLTNITRGLAQQSGAADDVAYVEALRAIHKAQVLKAEYQRPAPSVDAKKAP